MIKKIDFKKLLFVVIFIALSALAGKVSAGETLEVNNFNPNYIISDDEILDDRTMSLADVQRFLEAKGSFLAGYSCADAGGTVRKASEIIHNAAANNYDCESAVDLSSNPTDAEKALKCEKISINPKFILVLLQKEQSLVENSSPSQSQLDWAAGYGCPDGAACGSRWKGFGKQVNSAALQFYDYMVNPGYYTYRTGSTYAFTNPYSTLTQGSVQVTPYNRATAALYNYTPHVYNGNYNFYKIWQRWFSKYLPEGSLLQAKGENGVWLVQNGKKRPFTSRGALTSRFDIDKIITVNKADLDKYEKGAPIKFPQYSIVRSPNGGLFLLIDNKKRGFASLEAFKKNGFNPEEILDASWEDIDSYVDGSPITASTTYLTGALVQNKITGGVYWFSDNRLAPVLDRIFLKTKFKNKKITPMAPKVLTGYATATPVVFDDGEILKDELSPSVYVIANGQKRPVISGEIFESLGYKWSNVLSVPRKIIELYETGKAINPQAAPKPELAMEPAATSTAETATSVAAAVN